MRVIPPCRPKQTKKACMSMKYYKFFPFFYPLLPLTTRLSFIFVACCRHQSGGNNMLVNCLEQIVLRGVSGNYLGLFFLVVLFITSWIAVTLRVGVAWQI